MTRVAAIQMVSSPRVSENMQTVERLVSQAVADGAEVVLLPEYWTSIGVTDDDRLIDAEAYGHGPIQEFMSDIAKKHGILLIGGTLSLIAEQPNKVYNTTLVYDSQGQVVTRYDKIHLFNFSSATGENYDESRVISSGHQVTTFEASFGRCGLSVCYDLRFPELYRAMGKCALIVVPASFTYTTGQVHWEVLLRARAIENQTYILAAAQGGRHATGRRTWGHSMLIDPWGEIQSLLPEGEGVVIGDLDFKKLAKIRERLPALEHRKL